MSTRSCLLGRLVVAVAVLVPLPACIVDEGPSPPATVVDAAVPEDARPANSGGSVGGASLTVRVVGGVAEAEPQPVPGALVILSAPGGAELRATTDRTGRARFVELDFEQGTAAATVQAPGFALTSRVGITPPLDEVPLTLYGLTARLLAQTVRVSGTARHLAKPDLTLEVSASTSRDRFIGSAADWDLLVPPGLAFLLTAVEVGPGDDLVSARGQSRRCFGWAFAGHDGTRTPVTLDLDFGRRVASRRVHGAFTVPASSHSDLMLHGHGEVMVTTGLQVGAILGLATYLDVAPGGHRFDYEVEWIEPLGVLAPITVLSVSQPYLQWQRSWAVRPGYPVKGDQEIELLDAPVVLWVNGYGVARPLTAPIWWTEVAPEHRVRLLIMRGLEVIWVIDAAPGTNSLQVPPVPSTVAAAGLLGGGPLGAVLQVTAPPDDRHVRRGAQSELFSLTP